VQYSSYLWPHTPFTRLRDSLQVHFYKRSSRLKPFSPPCQEYGCYQGSGQNKPVEALWRRILSKEGPKRFRSAMMVPPVNSVLHSLQIAPRKNHKSRGIYEIVPPHTYGVIVDD
jgi:hypothetical protein